MDTPQTTWADPSLAGLFSLGAGTTAVWAAFTGRVGPQDLPILVIWLLSVAFVQGVTGLIALKRGDALGGAIYLSFAALFWGAPAATTAMLIGQPALTPDLPTMTLATNGWVFALLGLVLASFLPIFAQQSALSMIAIGLFSVAVFLLAGLNLQSPETQAQAPWNTVGWFAGWLIGLAGLAMVYLGVATAWSIAFGRNVLPIPPPVEFFKPAQASTSQVTASTSQPAAER